MTWEEFLALLKPILASKTSSRTYWKLASILRVHSEANVSIITDDTPPSVEVSSSCICFHYNGKKLVQRRLSGTTTIDLNKEGDFIIAKYNFSKLYIVMYRTTIRKVPPL